MQLQQLNSDLQPLPVSFYNQPTIHLAQALLGCLLIKETPVGIVSGIIVETEAYIGPDDQAAHSYNNRRTKRTEVMFGEPGFAYTYSMHTHCLVNVVSGERDKPEAVLIRAIEPFANIELMATRRPKIKDKRQLTNGPGKLCKALNITMSDYGHPLTKKPLWIAQGPSNDFIICSGTRVGIENAGLATHYPWRYWIKGNPFVSR